MAERLAVHSRWRWSPASRRNMAGVHPDLLRFADAVLRISPIDLCVLPGGGLRSQAQAADNVARGTGIASSLHLRQPDGYAHAIDLVAFQGGRPRWERGHYVWIRRAGLQAAAELQMLVQHGADWDADGVPEEPGEHDWPHWQLPKLPHRIADCWEQMLRTRRELGLPPTDERTPPR